MLYKTCALAIIVATSAAPTPPVVDNKRKLGGTVDDGFMGFATAQHSQEALAQQWRENCPPCPTGGFCCPALGCKITETVKTGTDEGAYQAELWAENPFPWYEMPVVPVLSATHPVWTFLQINKQWWLYCFFNDGEAAPAAMPPKSSSAIAAFFLAFVAWFAFAPLMPVIKTQIGLSKADGWTVNIASVFSTVFMRFAVGPLCDEYGPRNLQCMMMLFGGCMIFIAAIAVLGSIVGRAGGRGGRRRRLRRAGRRGARRAGQSRASETFREATGDGGAGAPRPSAGPRGFVQEMVRAVQAQGAAQACVETGNHREASVAVPPRLVRDAALGLR